MNGILNFFLFLFLGCTYAYVYVCVCSLAYAYVHMGTDRFSSLHVLCRLLAFKDVSSRLLFQKPATCYLCPSILDSPSEAVSPR